MKVLLGTEAYWPINDGGSVFERNLVKGLVTAGHEVIVVAPSSDGKPSIQTDDGYPIHRLRSLPVPFIKTYRFTFFAKSRIERIIGDFQPDVIHVHNPYDIGRSCMRLSKKLRIPIVATNHLMPENAFYNLAFGKTIKRMVTVVFWKDLIRFHNKADFVTSPTETAIKLLTDHGLTAPHKAVSNGIGLDLYAKGTVREDLKQKYGVDHKPVLLYVGRLDGEKRMDIWLDAAAKILKDHDIHCLIAGQGNAKDALMTQAQRLGIENKVTFAGRIPEDEKADFYRLGTVFAIASPAELQSLVTLEAMASGLPVVAVNVAALPELCHDGENGFLFEENDSAAMAEKAAKILTDPSLAEKMGAKSLEIVQHHSLPSMVHNYTEIYQSLVSARRDA